MKGGKDGETELKRPKAVSSWPIVKADVPDHGARLPNDHGAKQPWLK
jgi:hypothetical protein